MRQYWVAPVGPFHTADGTAYATSITLTDVSPAPQITLPANMLEIGSEIELEASGFFSNTATPTLLLGFYLGGVAGVALAASTAVTTTTAAVAWPFQLRYRGVVRSIGAAGSIVGQGRLYLPTSLVASTTRFIPETAALRTVAIDTTVAKTVTVGAQWGTSSASNTLTCQDLSVRLVT
ncbi:MAG: hypothetical protein ABIR39_12210 [Nocardioides sp.]|uniref:hypothetical protein n=1 Tax=Nocardioides sp. TaxID=35761 RepID=UPI0032654131